MIGLELPRISPVQRIAKRCAHVTMPIKFSDITENVFIACPLFLSSTMYIVQHKTLALVDLEL